MNEDRRASRRTEVRLPFQWQVLRASDTLASQLQRWGLDLILRRQHRQAELEGEFEQAARAVNDPAAAAALRALSTRLELLETIPSEAMAAITRHELELSAEGVGFCSTTPLRPGDRLAIHMILPSGYQLTGEASVSRCQSHDGRYRIGAELNDLDSISSRRLTRLIIS